MVIALKGSELSLALKGGRILYDASRPSNQQHDGNRNARMGMEHGRFLAALSLACAFGLAGPEPSVAASTGSNVNPQPPTAASGPTMNDADFWVGKNISAVVKVFGQPTYWNANHDGGGGGSRYIYSNPGQPHFVFETQSGQMIVHAVRIP
jgi:hypothetical protein